MGHSYIVFVWRKNTSYQGVANLYAIFVIKYYGKAIVVYDGYGDILPIGVEIKVLKVHL